MRDTLFERQILSVPDRGSAGGAAKEEIPIFVPFSPGFVSVAKTIYEDLASIGANPLLVCPPGMLDDREKEIFSHIEIANTDIFSLPHWFFPEYFAAQFHAIQDLIEKRGWKTLVTTPFNVSYVFWKKRYDLKIILIGTGTLLWPLREDAPDETLTEGNKHFRLREWMRFIDQSRPLTGIDDHVSLSDLFGDLYLMRSIPELDDEDAASMQNLIFAGSLLRDNRADASEVPPQVQPSGKGVCYFHHGRHFQESDSWGICEAILRTTDYDIVLDLERYDGTTLPAENERITIGNNPSLHAYAESIRLIVGSGSPTPPLFALENGIPLIMTFLTSGGHELAEVLVRRNLCTVYDSTSVTPAEVIRTLPRNLEIQRQAIARSNVREGFERARLSRPGKLRAALEGFGYF